MGTEENRRTLLDAMDAFGRGDFATYFALYADDAVLHGYTPEPLDRQGIVAFYTAFGESFSGATLLAHDTVAEGDRVTVRFTLAATHTGAFQGVPATGNPIRADGITILRFRDGRCVERWSSFDFLTVLTQIGAIPAPAAA